MEQCSFEVILTNLKNAYKDVEEKNIHYLLLSHSAISQINVDGKVLEFKYYEYKLKQEVYITNDTFGEKVLRISIMGSYEGLESIRGVFFDLMTQCSNKRYVIKDEVSMQLCTEAYPYINKVENLFRQYIMHFMILKVGDDWWKLNVSDANKEKSSQRDKKSAFQNVIDQNIYHIDFKDLLSFIYDNFSAFKTKNEILSRLKSCESYDEFKNLRESVLSNKEKFFAGIFEDSFKEKWEELAELRNQIAHNKLLEKKQLESIKLLSNELSAILVNALDELQMYTVTQAESEVYRETVQFRTNTVFESSVRKLKEEYNFELEDVKLAISSLAENDEQEYFTLVDLVEKLTNETYVVNSPINSYLGHILGNGKEELNLIKGENRIVHKDENNDSTTLTMWKSVKNV